MKRFFYFGIFLGCLIILSACSPASDVVTVTIISAQVTSYIQPTLTTTPFPSPTIIVTQTSIPTVEPTATNTKEFTPTSTSTPSPTPGPIFVANLALNPFRESTIPSHIWWSDDSQTLFYQDVAASLAWAYDVQRGVSSPIPYHSRLFQDIVPQFESSIPENGQIISVSPSQEYVLYRIPLAELVAFRPPAYQGEASPVYAFELWLLKDGERFNLGLIDSCFGLLESPRWSESENIAFVNTRGTPDVGYPCMYYSWLIDIETVTVGPFPTPWEENRQGYRILDVSADGKVILVRADKNRIFNRETGEEMVIPDSDTNRAIFINPDHNIGALVFQLIPPYDTNVDTLWYFYENMIERQLLFTINGGISQGIISPNQHFFAFTITNEFGGIVSENSVPSLWVVEIPQFQP